MKFNIGILYSRIKHWCKNFAPEAMPVLVIGVAILAMSLYNFPWSNDTIPDMNTSYFWRVDIKECEERANDPFRTERCKFDTIKVIGLKKGWVQYEINKGSFSCNTELFNSRFQEDPFK